MRAPPDKDLARLALHAPVLRRPGIERYSGAPRRIVTAAEVENVIARGGYVVCLTIPADGGHDADLADRVSRAAVAFYREALLVRARPEGPPVGTVQAFHRGEQLFDIDGRIFVRAAGSRG